MNLLKEFVLQDRCSYLDDKEHTMHYKIINHCGVKESQELIERGYRRFGRMYFRPICAECEECQSIKIDVANFHFSKSARRILKKSKQLDTYIQHPTITQEHLEIFDKYHRYMRDKKGWDYTPTTIDHYYGSFVMGHENFGYEILYYHEKRLIAVDLIDILEDGISSIYFYYDPEYAHLSLGKLSLYNQIRYAKEAQKPWIYLGYYVKDCISLSYKDEYKPYITLQGRPQIDEPYIWQ